MFHRLDFNCEGSLPFKSYADGKISWIDITVQWSLGHFVPSIKRSYFPPNRDSFHRPVHLSK